MTEFPSPYGVTVIKSRREADERKRKRAFPSPYGVTVIKSPNSKNLTIRLNGEFPSPYGVTVIKSINLGLRFTH